MIPEKNGTYNACSTVESCHKGENCSWKRRNGSRLQGVKQTGVRTRARPLLFLTCQEGVLRIKTDGVKHHFSTQNWIMEFQRMKIKWHHDFEEKLCMGCWCQGVGRWGAAGLSTMSRGKGCKYSTGLRSWKSTGWIRGRSSREERLQTDHSSHPLPHHWQGGRGVKR